MRKLIHMTWKPLLEKAVGSSDWDPPLKWEAACGDQGTPTEPALILRYSSLYQLMRRTGVQLVTCPKCQVLLNQWFEASVPPLYKESRL
jgi:hypothetical protein